MAFVLAVLFPIAGFVLSIVGLSKSDLRRNRSKYVAALVLSCVMFIIESILAWIVIGFVAGVFEFFEGVGELEEAGF